MAGKSAVRLPVLEKYDYEISRFRKIVQRYDTRSIINLLRKRNKYPSITLIVGDTGVGKTELALELQSIAEKAHLKSVWIDWRNEANKYPHWFKYENSDPEHYLGVIYTALRDEGTGNYKEYESAKELLAEAERKFSQAIDSISTLKNQETTDAYEKLRMFSARTIRTLVGIKALGPLYTQIPGSFKELADTALAETIRNLATGIAKARLNKKEYDVFLNGPDRLTDALAKGIQKSTRSQSIMIVLDDYELIAHFDAWIRYLIWKSGPDVMWVIASKSSPSSPLLDEYRNDVHVSKGLIDIQVLPLTIIDVEKALKNHPLKKRDPTPGEVKVVYDATTGNPMALLMAMELWQPGGSTKVEIFETQQQRSRLVTPVFEHYIANAISDSSDRSILQTYAFCFMPIPELLEHLTNDDSLKVIEKIQLQHPYLFNHGELTHGARFWLREELVTRLSRPEFQEIAKKAQDWWYSDLLKFEKEYTDLAECVLQKKWQELALATIYHCFWIGDSDAYSKIVFVLKALLLLPIKTSLSFVTVLRMSIGPLLQAQPRLKELLNLFENNVLKCINADEFPREGGEVKWEQGILKSEDGAVVADMRPETMRRVVEIFDSTVNSSGQRLLAGHILRASYLITYNNNPLAAARTIELGLKMCPVEPKTLIAMVVGSFYQKIGLYLINSDIYVNVALECLLETKRLNGESAPLLSNVALACLNLCNYDAAIEWSDQAIALDHYDGSAYNTKGGALNALGRYEDAEDAIKKGLEVEQTPPVRVVLYTSLAVIYMNQRKLADADEQLDAALEMEPTFPAALACKSMVAQIRDPERALFELRKAVDFLRAVDDFFVRNAIKILASTDNETAIAVMEQILTSAQKHKSSSNITASLNHEIGVRYVDMGQNRKALDYFLKALDLSPRYLPAYFNAAMTYRAIGKHREARSMLLRALEMNVGAIQGLMKGMLLDTSIVQASSKTIVRRVMDLPKSMKGTHEAHLHKGMAELLVGKTSKAIPNLRLALKENPDDFFLHFMISGAEALNGNLDAAIRSAENTIVRLPEGGRGFAYYHLANILCAQDKYPEAMESYQKSLSEYNKDSRLPFSIKGNISFDMAMTAMKQGNEEDAMKYFNEAFSNDPWSWQGRVSRIILLLDKDDVMEAKLEARRIERDANWEKELDFLGENTWKTAQLKEWYNLFVVESMVKPVLMAALLTGDKDTINRLLEKCGQNLLGMVDISHPVYAISSVSWPTVLDQMMTGSEKESSGPEPLKGVPDDDEDDDAVIDGGLE